MRIKFLQLNIFGGKYFQNIAEFAKKENFDILNFQEVSGKKYNGFGDDSVRLMKKHFPRHHFSQAFNWRDKHDPKIYGSIATLSRKNIHILESKIIHLKKYQIIDQKNAKFQDRPHCALSQKIKTNGKPIQIINTHLVWGPTPKDTKYKTKQNQKLVSYIKSLKIPFILSGDFNLDPSSQIVKAVGKIAVDVGKKYKIKNTLNPRVYYAKHLFPPGLVVDYIFVSKKIKIKSCRVLENENLSDHLGIAAEFEL